MKKNIIVFLMLSSIGLNMAYTFSQKNSKCNRSYFTIDPNDRKILLPVQINDSITGNFVFDTFYTFLLDSGFCSTHKALSFYNDTAGTRQVVAGSFFSSSGMNNLIHNRTQTIKIGDSPVSYNHPQVYDLKGYMVNNHLDGAFNIPKGDSLHVWELNFDKNYLRIHREEDFTMPENCFVVPIAQDFPGDKLGERNAIKVRLPMNIQFRDGSTLCMDTVFYIDTGLPWDVALMRNTKESRYFNKQNNVVWTEYLRSYYRHCEVKATNFDGFTMDSIRIYTFDYPTGIDGKYLLGINFLKRFNVFFDMRGRRIGFQPVKEFQRIVSPLDRRFHYSTMKSKTGKVIINFLADYPGNYYKKAGLQAGDQIVAVDGKPYSEITREERRDFHKKDKLVYDIIRNRKAIKIVVIVDKNEE